MEPEDRPDDARERWNLRYAARRSSPPGEPSPWLQENADLLSGLAGRRALDLACGDGRNAVFLARRGFAVDAVDISDVAIEALATIAGRLGLTVRPARLDLERDALPGGGYDVILMLNYLQRSLFAPLPAALAPGGIVIAETVTRAHRDVLGHDFGAAFLLEPGELRAAFPGLEVVRDAEGVVARAGRPRAVAGIVARRPAPVPTLS